MYCVRGQALWAQYILSVWHCILSKEGEDLWLRGKYQVHQIDSFHVCLIKSHGSCFLLVQSCLWSSWIDSWISRHYPAVCDYYCSSGLWSGALLHRSGSQMVGNPVATLDRNFYRYALGRDWLSRSGNTGAVPAKSNCIADRWPAIRWLWLGSCYAGTDHYDPAYCDQR